MTKPTDAQIEAAREALGDVAGQIYLNGRISDAAISAAITAAAEVGDDEDNIVNWMSSIKRVVANAEAATIERCAQVADKMATEIETHSYQDTATRLAAEMLRKAAAILRALKDKPAIDPNIVYPGKDDTNVFPEEES